jgi:sugar lactone lactonase YvrE
MAKKISATLFVSGIGNDICNPFFDANGRLHIIRQNLGSIQTVDNVGNTQTLFNTGGQPSYAIYNSQQVLYVADFGHSAILAFTKDGQQEMVVGIYEDKPLKGPNSIAMIDTEIFFTDSGSLGDTGLQTPIGSIFMIGNSPAGQVLKPIALQSLAYPAGIAVTSDKRFM